jgi:hypothetical protein
MTGGLLNIISYGCNDLYLTGAPQITFFKTVYRRYTNFSVESIEISPNTNTNFNEEFEVIIPRYGDLLSKTYLKIDIPEVYFAFNEFEFAQPSYQYNYLYKNNYDTVTEFMKYNMAGYRSINRDVYVNGITTGDISNNLFNLLNGDGQVAEQNFNNLYSNDLSGTINGIDIKYLLKTSNIFAMVTNLLATDTSNNIIIDTIKQINEKCKKSSVLCQKYYWQEYNKYNENYKLLTSGNLKFSWNNNLGHNMIEYIDVYIGGEFIDRTEGEFMEIYTQLTTRDHLQDAYSKLIGNTPELTVFNQINKPNYTLMIPLQFWFTKNYGSAFPLIASEHNDVIIKIKFRNINNCATIENLIDYEYTLEDLWNDKKYNLNCSLFVDFIYLDYLERKKFAQSAHEYLIENVQSAYEFVNNSNYTYKIDFKHPCKELLFFFQKIAYRDDTTGKYTNDFNNFCVDNNKTINPINFASLNLNGFEKINKQVGSPTYFNIMQPYESHKRTPDTGVYNYSFALVPEEIQPSGTLNFSRIKDVLMTFDINPNMFQYYLSEINPLVEAGSKDDQKQDTEVIFKIYCIGYNILRIKNGYCGLAFSAF